MAALPKLGSPVDFDGVGFPQTPDSRRAPVSAGASRCIPFARGDGAARWVHAEHHEQHEPVRFGCAACAALGHMGRRRGWPPQVGVDELRGVLALPAVRPPARIRARPKRAVVQATVVGRARCLRRTRRRLSASHPARVQTTRTRRVLRASTMHRGPRPARLPTLPSARPYPPQLLLWRRVVPSVLAPRLWHDARLRASMRLTLTLILTLTLTRGEARLRAGTAAASNARHPCRARWMLS